MNCHICNYEAILILGEEIALDKQTYWYCPHCKAYAPSVNGKPKSRMANAETRYYKRRAYAAVDKWRRDLPPPRRYDELGKIMGKKKFSMGWLTMSEYMEVIEVCGR